MEGFVPRNHTKSGMKTGLKSTLKTLLKSTLNITLNPTDEKVVESIANNQKISITELQKVDDLHNPYEIACGAAGAVEVVIDPKTL